MRRRSGTSRRNIVGWSLLRPPEGERQRDVRGQVEDRDHEGQRRREMQRRGLEGQSPDRVAEGEVEVCLAAGEAGEDKQRGCDGDLQREARRS